jgi:DNA topoisomerase VI subunit B
MTPTEMPVKPIITSAANQTYQVRIDKLAELAGAGDWAGVQAYEVKGQNTYAKMLGRYRDALLAVAGLERPGPSMSTMMSVPNVKRPIRDGAAALAPRLTRETFRTSRLLEFCSRKELVAQTGHDIADWPLVILKEGIDNAVDACEEAGIAPEILVKVSTTTGEISIGDNGPGIPAETVGAILDYTVRASSREAYCSPTRGAQGNALKTVVAMPFCLDGSVGRVRINANGVSHLIGFSVDHLRQEPVITREIVRTATTAGTTVTVFWPDSASSILAEAKSRFVQIASDFAWLNPHARGALIWDDDALVEAEPSDPSWKKWLPSLPTSPHWYDLARFERYIAAHVAHDRDAGREPERTVREFIADLDGFRRSASQKRVLDDASMQRLPLSSLFGPAGEPRRERIAELLHACKKYSRPVKPHLLGMIGKQHLLARFEAAGVHKETFKYKKAVGEINGLPWVVETAFGYCPEKASRRIITGVNFSVAVGNPFRSYRGYGGEGLEATLQQLRAGADEPIVFVLHYTCPRVEFTDRGKTALILPRRTV